ncbi:MAG: trimethylamine methyltransferase family protein [Anaerolineales bacterium]
MRPQFKILSDDLVQTILEEAHALLLDPGVRVHNQEALELLAEGGAQVDFVSQIAALPEKMVQTALDTAPSDFDLYDFDGRPAVHYGGDAVHFDPGSAAINLLDHETQTQRPPLTQDFVRFVQLVEVLPQLDAQSTALICADVPEEIGDLYRLYLALNFIRKPIVTGAFRKDTWWTMRELLVTWVGGEKELAQKPVAVFDVCPSPPLLWSDLTCQNLIDCARANIPAELVSMPLAGATAPVTLAGAVVQHAAECLSGVVICAYLGMTDSKIVDAQAGMEAAGGTILAALAGINMVSGAGMMDFESCQSFEKLVLDAEIIGMAKRLLAGIEAREETLALSVMRELGHRADYLTHPQTLRWFKEEFYIPSQVVDRGSLDAWERSGKHSAAQRAAARVEQLLKDYKPLALTDEMRAELRQITAKAAQSFGMTELPALDIFGE